MQAASSTALLELLGVVLRCSLLGRQPSHTTPRSRYGFNLFGALAVWGAYDRLPSARQTLQSWADAAAEAKALEDDDVPPLVNGREGRRRLAPLIVPAAATEGEWGNVFVPARGLDDCVRIATRIMAAGDKSTRASRALLSERGYTAIACASVRRSSVTGNTIVENEKRWELPPPKP